MELELRLLKPTAPPSDLDIVANFVSEYYAFDDLAYDDRPARRALAELINKEYLGRIWLLQLEQQPIGYLILTFGFLLEFHGRHAVIDEVYIRPSFRGHGYFRTALSFVEARCREWGVRCLRLEVQSGNVKAQKIYKEAGFQQHERFLMTKVLD